MRVSQFFLSTLKEAPAEAELVSHKLMLRAGLIKKLGSGLYTWMPLGLRVLRKVESIVREEMNRAGAIELLMPAVQPAELWQETGRWEQFGPQMLKIKDRHERDFCFGPTHEEVVTDIARKEIRSYRQLPLNLYQIQTKFRDEIRPRFGVMRAREFLMKDAYSFHASYEDLQREYRNMYDTYARIFTRLGLKFRAVAADTGAIGGTGSHEFHVLADSGEDAIAFCPTSDYAANVELAEALAPPGPRAAPGQKMEKVPTPGKTTCEEVTALLGLPLSRSVKALAVMHDDEMFMLLVRGDHQLNEVKTAKIPGLNPFRFASDREIEERIGCRPGYIGPVGLPKNIKVIADRSVAAMSDFVCGANEAGYHLVGVNFGRDLPEPIHVADLRDVVAGDPSPDGKGRLEICRGIEVGHVFQLRTKYSEAMQATFLDETGVARPMEMGCYGIGVSRIVAAAIEQGNDARGIVWPLPMAPFQVAVAPIGYERSEAVREAADQLHDELEAVGFEVLLDDRGERPGVMFADLELIGLPYRVTVGERGLKEGKAEVQARTAEKAQVVDLQSVAAHLKSLV
ncbi:MAG TPA: proline--tRNA ligase [Burkholderiales bacterium]|jgi:prolyl-tRNA synthetase|nr:proline--tRNA ligase [Burkholderiales bacterium]